MRSYDLKTMSIDNRQWQRQRHWENSLITFLTLENNNLDIHFLPSTKSDKGQHLQFLQCFLEYPKVPDTLLMWRLMQTTSSKLTLSKNCQTLQQIWWKIGESTQTFWTPKSKPPFTFQLHTHSIERTSNCKIQIAKCGLKLFLSEAVWGGCWVPDCSSIQWEMFTKKVFLSILWNRPSIVSAIWTMDSMHLWEMN